MKSALFKGNAQRVRFALARIPFGQRSSSLLERATRCAHADVVMTMIANGWRISPTGQYNRAFEHTILPVARYYQECVRQLVRLVRLLRGLAQRKSGQMPLAMIAAQVWAMRYDLTR